MGTAHPTGYPTYVAPRLVASVLLQALGEPAWRMNVCRRDLPRRRRRGHDGPGPGPDALAGRSASPPGSAWRLRRVRLDLGTHAEAAHPPRGVRRRPAAAPRRLGGRPAGAERRRTLLWPPRVVFGLSVGNHSLTLLLVPAVVLFVLAVEPRHLAAAAALLACLRRGDAHDGRVYLELPLRAGPFRAPLVYAKPQHLGRLLVHRPRRSSSRTRSGSVRRLAGVRPASSWAGPRAGFGPLAIVLPLAFIATARPPAALRAPDRRRVRLHRLLRHHLRRTPTSTATTSGPTLIGLDLAGRARRRRGRRDPASDRPHRLRGRADRLDGARPPPRSDGDAPGTRTAIALGVAGLLLVPTVVLLPSTLRGGRPTARTTRAQRWLDRPWRRLEPNAVVAQLVELLHAAMVRTAHRRPATGRRDHRRPDPPRRDSLESSTT